MPSSLQLQAWKNAICHGGVILVVFEVKAEAEEGFGGQSSRRRDSKCAQSCGQVAQGWPHKEPVLDVIGVAHGHLEGGTSR